jgi:predicted MPP superfamily phosphohydrolase
MSAPVPWSASLIGLALVTATGAALAMALFPRLMRSRRLRIVLAGGVGLLAMAHVVWGASEGAVGQAAMVVSCVGLVVLGFAVASIAPAALVERGLHRVLTKPASARDDRAPLTRRRFVAAATALVPTAAVATALRGFGEGTGDVRAPLVPLPFAALPTALDGLTLLHLSDLHLGVARDLADLDRFLARVDAGPLRPDLIVLTGDVADDVRQLGPALALVAGFGARLGAVACLGNHEYLRDIRVTRPLYERSRVPLLVDRGLEISGAGARLFVGGIDDPVALDTDVRPALRGSVERVARDAPTGVFRLLLAHRPEAFDAAHAARFDLVLSGHTHGGQIGFNGKSAFEPLWPDGYLWGSYRRGDARLYTTSGFGNWFPFRLGCPAQAPLLELTRRGA